jgi:hypothetical protein
VNFNDAAVMTVFDKVVSYALASGRFDHVNQHEPKNSPGNGISCSVWIHTILPYRPGSGMGATTGVVVLNSRLYTNFRQQPYDMIDPNITAATCDLIGAITADFNFGGDAGVRNVDLLGMTGTSLSAQAGYVEIDRQMFRVMTIVIPVVVNDMFMQGAT